MESNQIRAQSYASVGRRIAAYLLDLTIAFLSVIVPVYLITRVLIAAGAWAPAQGQPAHEYVSRMFVVIAFLLSTGPISFVLCHASPWQATLGKRLLNIYVARDDGKRIGFARSFVRSVTMYLFSFCGGALVSVITIAVTQQRKALHDFAAYTIVLRGRPVPGGPLEFWRIATFTGVPIAWMLGTLLMTM